MSKRQQARNERTLQDLIRSVPGNDECADCKARNPGWASWNLGVFLCMRCASLHRKLGTHISKVKSLSMDTWSTEQVENMKSHGNVIVNKTYNPRNVRPDMPLDADEVDSAMERFIKKKYQEQSLGSGKPRLPSRGDTEPAYAQDDSPPPPLPPKNGKKGKFFGFGLRASSSAYPLSTKEKKKITVAPTFEGAFGMASTDFDDVDRDTPTSAASDSTAPWVKEALREKIQTLKEMGFSDEDQNSYVLQRLNGNFELAVEYLVKHGRNKPQSKELPPIRSARKTSANVAFPDAPNSTTTKTLQTSTDLFGAPSSNETIGLSFASNEPQAHTPTSASTATSRPAPSYNPFDATPVQAQTPQSFEQSFDGMQISQPLFPNSTGGYPAQSQPNSDPRLQTMTPPVPLIPQQYGYVASPPAMGGNFNPFFQGIQNQQVSQNQQGSFSNSSAPAASSNPFFHQMSSTSFAVQHPQPTDMQQPMQQAQISATSSNPFGIPPSKSQFQLQQIQQQNGFPQSQSIFDQNQQTFSPNNASTAQPIVSQQVPEQQSQLPSGFSSSNPFGNFQGSLPQQQYQQPVQAQPPQQFQQSAQAQPPQQFQQSAQAQPQQQLQQPAQAQPQQQFQQPAQAQPQQQFQQPAQAQFQQQQQPQFQQQFQQPSQPQYNFPNATQQPLYPQQTGRIDKNSILALYNYPHLAPQKPPLPSIPEPTEISSNTISPAPSEDIFSGTGALPSKRSATMPIPLANSSTLTGSRNPFLKNSGNGTAAPNMPNQGGGGIGSHGSRESVMISNLDSGRHSPDAFANLSARFVR